MSECCNNHLGEFPHNEDIVTDIPATIVGDYKISLEYQGAKTTKTFSQLYGSVLIIEQPFNENYLYKFTVTDPNGDPVEVANCPNFSFKTFVNINPDCNGNLCDD